MKPTKLQILLAYVASIFLMLTVFHRPLGFADYWEWIFDVACGASWVSFFVLRWRQKAALAPEQTVPAVAPRPNKKIMWLSLVLIVAVSLSSFLWLPYTGVALPRMQAILVSLTTCILSVAIYLIAWRRSRRV